MRKRSLLQLAVAVVAAAAGSSVLAQDNVFKIGLILPMTGQQATTGRQIEAAAKLYMQLNGDTVAGKKIQLIVKDDTSLPDVTRRLAQELVVNEKVDVLAGFGITPSATATAPIATQSKTPQVVMAAAITTSGVFDCVAIGAVAVADGVMPKPASTLTLSFTTSSCASRRVTSGRLVSSLTISSIFLPATVSPFCAMYSLAAASIWRPVVAC